MTEWYEVSEERRIIDPDERGFQYGDGLFETIAIRHGEPRLWDYHVRRLEAGCKRLALKPPAVAALRHQLGTAIAESARDSDFCTGKIIVTAGILQRGYGRPTPTDPSIYIGVFPAVPVSQPASRRSTGLNRYLPDRSASPPVLSKGSHSTLTDASSAVL
jgi:4-amino-4-deoxychorismate lyase